ncbi:hypothetical protein HDU99_005809 [Rhizoclosmatium hyalinum]|nr:hypothetical protein HDU99_005809 [Rhizoclosmatium hyalinum]
MSDCPLLYFYGTLMHPHVLFAVLFGDSKIAHPQSFEHAAVLCKNHTRYPIHNIPYPAMIPDESAASAGVLGMVTSVHELAAQTGLSVDTIVQRLDRFEGSEYRRILVSVELAVGRDGYGAADGYGATSLVSETVWKKYAGDKDAVQAWAYEWIGGSGDDVLVKGKGDWDYDNFVKNKLSTYI